MGSFRWTVDLTSGFRWTEDLASGFRWTEDLTSGLGWIEDVEEYDNAQVYKERIMYQKVIA